MKNSNGTWLESLFNRKDKETLAKDIKRASARDIRAFQKERLFQAIKYNPEMTAGNFAKHHNTMLRRLK